MKRTNDKSSLTTFSPVILPLAFLLVGCSHTYQLTRTNAGLPKLAHDATAYVAVSENGKYGNIVYNESGETTTYVLAAEFSKHLVRLSKATGPESYQQALESAHKGNFRYLVYPTILHWEDRATEWSGKPDRISVKIMVVDTQTDNVVSSIVIEGRSRWFTFGGDHPQDLLPEPIREYVESLF